VRLEPALIEPGAVVRAAADVVTPAATSKRIELHVSEGPTLWGVVADPARLQQVVWNLIDALLLDLAMPGVPEREAARQRERRAHQRRQARSKDA
jgi:C4-dicarboxylate-specific signal transduction histidine kinase